MTEKQCTEVLEADDRRWEAIIAADGSAMEDLFADELVYTHSNGLVDSKESYIASITTGPVSYKSAERSDVKVSCRGDVAVVTGKARVLVELADKSMTIHYRYSAVWVNDAGDWKFFVWHACPIDPE